MDIPYTLVRKKKKSISISIKHDGSVVVSAPYRVSEKRITDFIRSKESWITKHTARKKSSLTHVYGKYPLLGELYTIVPADSNQMLTVDTHEDTKKLSIQFEQKDIEKYIRTDAEQYLTEQFYKTLESLSEFKKHKPTLSFKTLKSRWGSCSSKKEIILNRKLYSVPPVCIEYVIVHELCHLIHMNHGPQFKELLGSIMPHFRTVEKELKTFGWILRR